MDWAKILILPLAILLPSLILFCIEHFYQDRRTKKYKLFRNLLLIALGITTIINGYYIYHDQQQANKSYDRLVESMNKESIQFEKRHNESKIQRDSLKQEILYISEMLNPFIEISRKKFPNFPIDDGLEKLTEELNELKEKTDIIENRIKPRHLSSDVSNYIINELLKYKSQDILLQFDPTDIEARTYANELKVSIQNGGWNVKDFQLQAMQPNPGISINCRNNEKSQKIAKILWSILKNSGVYNKDDIYLSDSSGGNWIIKLYVGPKYED